MAKPESPVNLQESLKQIFIARRCGLEQRNSIWRVTSEGQMGLFPRSPLGGANELEGQFRGLGLSGWFPWCPRCWEGMHPANCGERTGPPGPMSLGGGGVRGRRERRGEVRG